MAEWYKLGGAMSSFWDPAQPNKDNTTLAIGQAKLLEETERVTFFRKGEGLIRLTEKEAQELIGDTAAKAQAAKLSSNDDAITEANKVLEDAQVKLKEAELKSAAADEAVNKATDLEKENAELKKALKNASKAPKTE
jgi:hypothetical protein